MTRERPKQKIERFTEDTKWVWKRYDDLKKQYPDEWVAVFKEKVVDHDSDLRRLMGRLDVKYPEDKGHIAVEFVTPKKIEMIL